MFLRNIFVARHFIFVCLKRGTRACHGVDDPQFFDLPFICYANDKMLGVGTPCPSPYTFPLAVSQCVCIQVGIRHAETEVFDTEGRQLGLHYRGVQFFILELAFFYLVVLDFLILLAAHFVEVEVFGKDYSFPVG